MILSQITRSDVRFELLLCTSDAENLSPVVASVAQTVVGPGTIAVVTVVCISVRLGSGGGLSLSGPLAVVGVSMMGIGVSVSVGSVAQTVVTSVSQTVTIDSVVGISLRLSSGGGLS